MNPLLASSRSPIWRNILLSLWFVLASPQQVSAEAWGLEDLMRTLAENGGGRVRFHEKKYIALLDQPVESSGELVYLRPDHLEKITIQPKSEILILDRGTLRMERDGRKQSLQLSDAPQFAAFIESLLGTLAGERAALERFYRLYLGGSSTHWTLRLLPIPEEVRTHIRQIKVMGEGAQLSSVEIELADGDRSVMNIQPLDTPP